MALLNILKYPDEKLRTPADSVVSFDNKVFKLLNDMLETMYFNKALGLAATQVDIHKQIIVIDAPKPKSEYIHSKLVIINPDLLESSGGFYSEESCLSIPNYVGFTFRYKSIYISVFDIKDYSYKLRANGILAICIQHEVDHLFGKLFIDH